MRIYAPISGVMFPIENLNDDVFSNKIVGDGIYITQSEGDTIYSPCNGKVIQKHKYNYALCIQTDDGVEIVLHIGIGTVHLKGEGFTPLVKENDMVEIGQPLIKFNRDTIKENLQDLPIMVLVQNSKILSFETLCDRVEKNTPIFDIDKIESTDLKIVKSDNKLISNTLKIKRLSLCESHTSVIPVIVKVAKRYKSSIYLIKNDGTRVNAKIINSIRDSKIRIDDDFTIEVFGDDAEEAINTIYSFLQKM